MSKPKRLRKISDDSFSTGKSRCGQSPRYKMEGSDCNLVLRVATARVGGCFLRYNTSNRLRVQGVHVDIGRLGRRTSDFGEEKSTHLGLHYPILCFSAVLWRNRIFLARSVHLRPAIALSWFLPRGYPSSWFPVYLR